MWRAVRCPAVLFTGALVVCISYVIMCGSCSSGFGWYEWICHLLCMRGCSPSHHFWIAVSTAYATRLMVGGGLIFYLVFLYILIISANSLFFVVLCLYQVTGLQVLDRAEGQGVKGLLCLSGGTSQACCSRVPMIWERISSGINVSRGSDCVFV